MSIPVLVSLLLLCLVFVSSAGHVASAPVDSSSSSGDVGGLPVSRTGVSVSAEDTHPPSRSASSSSADASWRMSTWIRERMGGESRSLVFVSELLLSRHTVLWALPRTCLAALTWWVFTCRSLGGLGAEPEDPQAVAHSVVVSDVTLIDDAEASVPSLSLSSPPPRAMERPRRQSAVVRLSADSAEAVSEAVMALVELLISGAASSAVEHSLSPAGLKVLRLFRLTQRQAASSSSSVPVSSSCTSGASCCDAWAKASACTCSSEPSSSSVRLADIIQALPVVNLPRSGPLSSASASLPRPSSVHLLVR